MHINHETWNLFFNSPSEQFVELFKKEFERTNQAPDLTNLGTVYLDTNRIQEARDAFRRALEMDKQARTVELTFTLLGISEWFLGNFNEAIKLWEQSLDAQFADEAGGVEGPALMWYGALRTENPKLKARAEKLVGRFWKIKDPTTLNFWPGPVAVAGYILDRVDTHTFLNVWQCENRTLELRRLCRANFWTGVKCDVPQTAREFFEEAFTNSKVAILEPEYFLAKWEFQRLSAKCGDE